MSEQGPKSPLHYYDSVSVRILQADHDSSLKPPWRLLLLLHPVNKDIDLLVIEAQPPLDSC